MKSDSKKAKSTRSAAATRALLVARYPACFADKGREKRPLRLGVHNLIMADLPEIGLKRLTAALGDYTAGPTYLRNVVAGATRIGLDGAAAGEVSAAEAEHAALRLSALQAFASRTKAA